MLSHPLARKIIIGLSILAVVMLGFLRDFIFVNINYQLQHLYYQTEHTYAHSFFAFLSDYSYQQLYYGKFALTALFTLLYLVLTSLSIQLIYRKRQWLKWILYLFGAMVTVAAIFYGLGYAFGNPTRGYKLARVFMGIVQSPIPLMVLIPAFSLIKKQ